LISSSSSGKKAPSCLDGLPKELILLRFYLPSRQAINPNPSGTVAISLLSGEVLDRFNSNIFTCDDQAIKKKRKLIGSWCQ
jgi:hypothetical protein